jgi:hypothetical protein
MITYKLLKDLFSDAIVGVNKDYGNGTITSIPFDPANRDYQEYLKWLDGYEYMMTAPMQMEWVKTRLNGNQPLPADE